MGVRSRRACSRSESDGYVYDRAAFVSGPHPLAASRTEPEVTFINVHLRNTYSPEDPLNGPTTTSTIPSTTISTTTTTLTEDDDSEEYRFLEAFQVRAYFE